MRLNSLTPAGGLVTYCRARTDRHARAADLRFELQIAIETQAACWKPEAALLSERAFGHAPRYGPDENRSHLSTLIAAAAESRSDGGSARRGSRAIAASPNDPFKCRTCAEASGDQTSRRRLSNDNRKATLAGPAASRVAVLPPSGLETP